MAGNFTATPAPASTTPSAATARRSSTAGRFTGNKRHLHRAAVGVDEHVNASASDEAILFSMHDEPILPAFGLFREEGSMSG